MDYEALRAAYAQMIPFNAFLELEITEIAPGRGVVTLPDRDELKNHVQSQHAGALFSAGEAASGAAFISAFAERMGDITPLAEKADIAYKKVARGPITATGTFEGDRDALFAELDREGRVRFPIGVSLTDGDGTEVASMGVDWYVRTKAA